ncbi:hypothetical protein CRUP_003089 [Coryphaenoides rupestris]|nr:hypothetical protein CRUP_003089 [Coryphaenoides rupestris]
MLSRCSVESHTTRVTVQRRGHSGPYLRFCPNLYVEGLRFPDSDFEGLVRINLSLLESVSEDLPETPIFTDSVMFRMAPWIMTPNTLDPVEVFVCR